MHGPHRLQTFGHNATAHLVLPAPMVVGDERVLLCDPLTGLVAYPSFESYLRDNLLALAPTGVHLAIGDVDDLKAHVTERRLSDPLMFGHIAGNICMRTVGSLTLQWAEEALQDWLFSACGTFGGDEVIVAAAGRPYEEFVDRVGELADAIRSMAPRPCSFATGSLTQEDVDELDPDIAYLRLVTSVDAALFDHKCELRAQGIAPNGAMVNQGRIDLAAGLPAPKAER